MNIHFTKMYDFCVEPEFVVCGKYGTQLGECGPLKSLFNAPFEKDNNAVVEQNRYRRFFNKPEKFWDAVAATILANLRKPLFCFSTPHDVA